MAKIIGNYGSVHGIGQANRPDGSIGWVGLAGKSGEIAYLQAVDCSSLDKIQQGYYFQATGGATVDFTLVNSARATNPDPVVQANIPWSNTLTVSSTIVPAEVAFAAIRITFTGDGELYIVSR